MVVRKFLQQKTDVIDMSNFADDNFIINWSKSKDEVVIGMEISLKLITKWLIGTGLNKKRSYAYSIRKTVLRSSSVLVT